MIQNIQKTHKLNNILSEISVLRLLSLRRAVSRVIYWRREEEKVAHPVTYLAKIIAKAGCHIVAWCSEPAVTYIFFSVQACEVNSLTTKNHDKFFVCNFSKNVESKLYYIENSKTGGQTVDLDEVAHYEPPHQDLHCLQIQLFSSLVVK